MNTESNNNREDKKPSPELMNKIHELINDFKVEIEQFEHLRLVAHKEDMSDKTLRTFLVANTQESCAYIDAILDRDYERAMNVRLDRVMGEMSNHK